RRCSLCAGTFVRSLELALSQFCERKCEEWNHGVQEKEGAAAASVPLGPRGSCLCTAACCISKPTWHEAPWRAALALAAPDPRLESFLDHTDLRAPGPRPHVDLLTGLRFGSQMPHFSLDPSLCLVLLGCYTLLWTPPHPTPFCQPADPRLPRKWQQSLLECGAVAVLPLALCWAGR
ncbi:hypothetical protein Cadr_000026194, partial [Camelus dromedarius]